MSDETAAEAEARNHDMGVISEQMTEMCIASYGPGFLGAVLTMTLGRLLALMPDDKIEEALAMHCVEAKAFREFFLNPDETRQ